MDHAIHFIVTYSICNLLHELLKVVTNKLFFYYVLRDIFFAQRAPGTADGS